MKLRVKAAVAAVLLLIPISIKAYEELYATISDSTIIYGGRNVTDKYSQDILVYDDTTYISVRDAAAIYDRDVTWDEENRSITIQRYNDVQVIDTPEMAEEIGKALLIDYFGGEPECITVYGYEEMYKTELWRVEIANLQGISRFVLIDSYSGKFGVYEICGGEVTTLACSL